MVAGGFHAWCGGRTERQASPHIQVFSALCQELSAFKQSQHTVQIRSQGVGWPFAFLRRSTDHKQPDFRAGHAACMHVQEPAISRTASRFPCLEAAVSLTTLPGTYRIASARGHVAWFGGTRRLHQSIHLPVHVSHLQSVSFVIKLWSFGAHEVPCKDPAGVSDSHLARALAEFKSNWTVLIQPHGPVQYLSHFHSQCYKVD